MKSNLFLFLIGILLSATTLAQPIMLTTRNHAVLSGQVTDATVAATQVQLGKLAVMNLPGSTIYLVLDTPGGSVIAGNQLIDFTR